MTMEGSVSFTMAERAKAQWADQPADKKHKKTLQEMAAMVDRSYKVVNGYGTKTLMFVDGSSLYISGRGRHYTVTVQYASVVG